MAQPTFVLSPEALADLEAIANYIATESGMLRAEGVIARITRALGTIAFMPTIGRRRPDLDGAAFRFPIPPWLILYEPMADLRGIYVLRIYDGRRDLDTLLGQYKRPRGR